MYVFYTPTCTRKCNRSYIYQRWEYIVRPGFSVPNGNLLRSWRNPLAGPKYCWGAQWPSSVGAEDSVPEGCCIGCHGTWEENTPDSAAGSSPSGCNVDVFDVLFALPEDPFGLSSKSISSSPLLYLPFLSLCLGFGAVPLPALPFAFGLPFVVAFPLPLPFCALVRAKPEGVTKDGIYVELEEMAGSSASCAFSFDALRSNASTTESGWGMVSNDSLETIVKTKSIHTF